MKIAKLPIIIISIGIVVIASWIFVVVPELKHSVSAFEIINERVGSDRIVTEIGEELPEQPIKTADRWNQKVINQEGNNLEIRSTIITTDLRTLEIIFESESVFLVDKYTRTHIEDPEKFFMFPINVQKKTYEFIHPLIYFPTKFVFEGEDEIDGLLVYIFSCNTSTDDISYAYSQFSQKILSDSTCRVWVEPITGIELWFEKTWHDYHQDQNQIFSVDKGSSKTTEFARDVLIDATYDRIKLYTFYDVMPIGIIIITASIAVIFLFQSKFKKSIIHVGQLEKINATLERVSMIGELTSRLVHDLKNPLSVISMNSQLMKMETTDEKVMNRIKQIDESYDSIMIQIQDTLDYVKHGKLTFRDTLLSGIISKAIKMTEIPDEIKVNQELKEITISADNLIMQVVFSNLLRNSVNAIEGKGQINIRVEEMKDKVKIEFEDSGQTIPQKDLEKIFDSVDITEFTGNNIGLVSCKKIIEKHNGEIKIKNDPTTFTVILPKTITGQ